MGTRPEDRQLVEAHQQLLGDSVWSAVAGEDFPCEGLIMIYQISANIDGSEQYFYTELRANIESHVPKRLAQVGLDAKKQAAAMSALCDLIDCGTTSGLPPHTLLENIKTITAARLLRLVRSRALVHFQQHILRLQERGKALEAGVEDDLKSQCLEECKNLIFTCAAKWQGTGEFLSYLCGACDNTCKQIMKTSSIQKVMARLSALPLDGNLGDLDDDEFHLEDLIPDSAVPSEDENVDRIALLAAACEVYQQVEPVRARAHFFHHWRELTFEDIAKKLNISAATAYRYAKVVQDAIEARLKGSEATQS